MVCWYIMMVLVFKGGGFDDGGCYDGGGGVDGSCGCYYGGAFDYG